MTATNVCSNFGGLRSSPPVDKVAKEKMEGLVHAKVVNDGGTVDTKVAIKGDIERQVVVRGF